jgi:DNA phosphorothioation-dependent restriction protein DptG
MATSDGQVTGYCRPMQKAFEDLLYKVCIQSRGGEGGQM